MAATILSFSRPETTPPLFRQTWERNIIPIRKELKHHWFTLKISHDLKEQWNELLSSGDAEGDFVFEDGRRQDNQVYIYFSLKRRDDCFSELALHEIKPYVIPVRRIMIKGRQQWRFFCPKCSRLRFDTMERFESAILGNTNGWICRQCPEFKPYWEIWRGHGVPDDGSCYDLSGIEKAGASIPLETQTSKSGR